MGRGRARDEAGLLARHALHRLDRQFTRESWRHRLPERDVEIHDAPYPPCTSDRVRAFSAFDDRGTLNIGAPADVAIMELREGTFAFVDNYKGTRTGHQRLFPVATVLAGKRTPARA